MRHRPATRSGHSFFGLLSVLALLALACFVPMAQADSSGIEYRDAPQTATGGEIPAPEDPATASKNGGAKAPGGSTASNESDNGSSEEETAAGGGGANGGGTGQADSGKSQGSPGKGSGTSKVSSAQSVAKAPASEDSGGSSPLVPILIAIAVLMAAAIAAVVIRQRRQRSGSDAHVSPEAS
jgi:hypothetical protein